mgnify:CR=1 FL=1
MPLTINIPGTELFDNDTQKFTDLPPTTLVLEHSLISISKWEAIWKKPWLGDDDKTSTKTNDELYSYIQCMCIKGNADDLVVRQITSDEYIKILDYIKDPMTASTVRKKKSARSNNFVTSELIYAWMVQYNIPPEYQKWHLNRLMMLINILDEINSSATNKKSEAELIKDYAKINAENRRRFHTKG